MEGLVGFRLSGLQKLSFLAGLGLHFSAVMMWTQKTSTLHFPSETAAI